MRWPFSRKPLQQAITITNQASLPVAVQSIQTPKVVFVEKEADQYTYSETMPQQLERALSALQGIYSVQNYIQLFNCLPELFSPIHEIASRVADCNWQLCKEWNDEVDYADEDFNRLFSKPNCLEDMKTFVYRSVVYEILTGGEFEYLHNVNGLLQQVEGREFANIVARWNLPAQDVTATHKKNIDPYSSTELSDFITEWKVPNGSGGFRKFNTDDVITSLNLSFEKPFDLNCRVPMVTGAEKPIKNLIPVYEARGVIYIKRGALGFVVSRKSDESGQQALTPGERKEANADFNGTYGVTGGRDTIGITALPVDFVRTAMSIQELQPFDETLADAVAIYKVLRVPRHLVPSKDTSTFANADADLKSFYVDVIIPWATKKAEAWNNKFKIPKRYIRCDYSHIEILQQGLKLKSETEKIRGEVWLQRFSAGTCCLNDWIADFGGTIVKTAANEPVKSLYELKLGEMTPEQIETVKTFINLKAQPKPEANNNGNAQKTD